MIATGSRASVFGGYLLGSALMVLAAIIEMIWGVAAERKPLETVSASLVVGERLKRRPRDACSGVEINEHGALWKQALMTPALNYLILRGLSQLIPSSKPSKISVTRNRHRRTG